MKVLRKAGLIIYGTGFAYTFKEAFLDTTFRAGRLEKGSDMVDYTVYSLMGVIMGVYAGALWPLPIGVKLVSEHTK